MLDAALFVSDAIREREIELGDGSKHKLHFRQVLSDQLQKMQTAKPEEAFAAQSRIIVASLCTPDGKDAINFEQAGKLSHGVRMAIAIAIAEVNELGAHVGKVSPPAELNGSGGSSS